jgi:hypothetical protein
MVSITFISFPYKNCYEIKLGDDKIASGLSSKEYFRNGKELEEIVEGGDCN